MCRQRRPLWSLLPLWGPIALASCGGGSSPTGPSPGRPTHPVVVVVFYDENGDGSWQTNETSRIPDVVVEVAGRTARSEQASGRAVIEVPEGTYAVTAQAASLPPFYQTVPGARPTVSSPQPAGSDVYFPLTLPIGSNQSGVYMAFGDSITVGDGSSSGAGYRDLLQARLQGYFGEGLVVDEGRSGSKSSVGVARISDALAHARPAYTLILYGTNDWNSLDCKINFPCYTIDSLRTIVRSVKATQGLPVLATIIPVNPTYEFAPERNVWVASMNELIRPLAQQEGAALADLHAAFLRAGDLQALFSDKLHPNDEGYEIIAGEFFRAITTPALSSSSQSLTSRRLDVPWAPGRTSSHALPVGHGIRRSRPERVP